MPVVDDGYPLAQPFGLFHVVGGVEDGHPFPVERLDALEDRIAALGVHSDGGLVQEKDIRLVQQAGGQVDPPLHPPRIAVQGLVGAVRKLHYFQYPADVLLECFSAQAVELAEEDQVIPGRERRVESQLLGHEAQAGLDGVQMALELDPFHQDLPAGGAG